MRTTKINEVSKMDVKIGKMHRELAKLYEERARIMQKVRTTKFVDASEIDFPSDVMNELAQEVSSRGKKAK